MASKLLDNQRIHELHAATIAAGLEAQRTALLLGIDAKFVASLTVSPAPSAQVLIDLHGLNLELGDGSVPIGRWLKNALLLAGPRTQAEVFQAALESLDASMAAGSSPSTSTPRDRLLAGIRDLPDDSASRIGSFIDAYAGTSDHSNAFCGRDADVDKLRMWLASDTSPPNLIVTAPAGRGKSALLVRLALELAQRDDVAVAFVPLSLRFDTHRPDLFLRCLVARLEELYGRDIPDFRHATVEILQRMLLDNLKHPLSGGRLAVILLDGLDEAVGWSLRPELLPSHHDRSIRIIVSARHQPDDPEGKRWRRDLGWTGRGVADCVTLPLLESRDVEAALGRLEAPLCDLSRRPEIVSELTRLCVGEPLTLWLMLEDMKERGETAVNIDVAELRARSPGLEACFEEWWELQRKHWAEAAPLREPAVRALLNLLVVADSGLNRADLLVLLHEEIQGSSALLDEAMRPLSRLIHGDGRASGYVPAHPGLAQHLRERLVASERRAWRERLARWSRDVMVSLAAGDLSPGEVPRYVVHNRVAQLHEESASVEEWMSLATRTWHDAWRAHQPGPSGFLGDLDQAWSAAEADGAAGMTHLTNEVQCALIRGSVGSVLANVAPDLMIQLLEHAIWTPEQALAYVREAPVGHDSSSGRGALVQALAPHLPPALLPQLFEITCGLAGRAFTNWVELLKLLLPGMAAGAPDECIVALRRIEGIWTRASLLLALAPHLAPVRRESVLREVRQLMLHERRSDVRALILKALAAFLSEPEKEQALREAFSAAQEIPETEPDLRYRVFVELASLLPADLQPRASAAALTAVGRLKGTDHYYYALEDLVQGLPTSGRDEAISLFIAEIEAASGLLQSVKYRRLLLNHLPEAERPAHIAIALDTVIRIDAEAERYDALESLLYNDDRLKKASPSWQGNMPHILRALQSIENPWRRLRLLSDMIALSPEEAWQSAESLWPTIEDMLRTDDTAHIAALRTPLCSFVPIERALATAQCARAPWLRAELLSWVAPRMSAEQRASIVEEAFVAAMAVETPRKRSEILLSLLQSAEPSQQQSLFEALREATAGIDEAYMRSDAWRRLASILADPWKSEALDAARASAWAIKAPDLRFEYLLTLIEIETPDRRNSAFDEALQTLNRGLFQRSRAKLLSWLVTLAPEPRRRALLLETLELTRKIGDIQARASTMTVYATPLPSKEIFALADDIEEIPSPSSRTSAYALLLERCPGAPEELFERALSAARKTGSELPGQGTRASHLGRLLNVAPQPARQALVREVLDLSRDDLERVVRPPAALFLEDRSMLDSSYTRGSFVDDYTATALTAAAPHLLPEGLFAALRIADKIVTVHARAKATLALAAHLDEIEGARIAERFLAEELPLMFRDHAVETRRQLALTLAPLLPEPCRSEVIAAATAGTKQPPPLASNLPDDTLFERVDACLSPQADSGQQAAPAIAQLVSRLPPERRCQIIGRVLDRVPALTPAMQAQILVRLLPYLPEPWIDRYLDSAETSGIGDHPSLASSAARLNPRQLDRAIALLNADKSWSRPRDSRIEALAIVAAERLRHPDPPRAQLWQSLHMLMRSQVETRADVLVMLSALAPLIEALGGTAASISVVQAIRRVGAWWQ